MPGGLTNFGTAGTNVSFYSLVGGTSGSGGSGTVTSISAGSGMSFATITTTGTVAIDVLKVPYISGGFSTGLLKWDSANWVFDNTSYYPASNPSGFTSGLKFGTASGTDTYTVIISGVTSYTDGDAYLISFTNGNTTTCTLNINGLGAVDLYRNNDGKLIGGDIVADAEILCVYNAAVPSFQCIGTAPNTLLAYVTNAESTTITKGQPVYVYGGQGDRITVKLAYNTSDATSAQTIGVVQSTSIAANQKGLVIIQGQLDNLSLFPTSTWADGDYIYLGATPGSVTNVKPSAPNHLVYLGYVTTANNGSAGRMYVKVQNGYELDEIHNVKISGVTNNDVLAYESTTSLWKNKPISGVLGYVPISGISSSDVTTALGYTPFGGTNPLPVANGGTGISSVIDGDILYATGGTIAKLAIGTSGQTLASNGTLPIWATVSSGGGMTNPMTTAGDTIYGGVSGTPTRLALGTSGYVLQAGASAPSWFNLFGTANTWTATQTFNPSITASSAIARSLYISSTLTAAANSDNLVALDFSPTFTPGAFTGVKQMYIRTPTTSTSTGTAGVYIGGNNAAGGTDLATSPDLWMGSGSSAYSYINFLSSSVATYGQLWYGASGSYRGFYFFINGTSATPNVYLHKFAFSHAGRIATIGQDADTIHSYSAPTFNNFYLKMTASNDNTRYFKIFTDNTSAVSTERFGIQGYANSSIAYFNNVAGLGINVTAPTALVHVASSTTAAASLRIAAGVAPTSPNNGDMWYDGSGLYFRTSTTSVLIPGANVGNTFTTAQTFLYNGAANRAAIIQGIAGAGTGVVTVFAGAASNPVTFTSGNLGIMMTYNQSTNSNNIYPIFTVANRYIGGYTATAPQIQLRFSTIAGTTEKNIEWAMPTNSAFTTYDVAIRYDLFVTAAYRFAQYYMRVSIDTAAALNPASALLHLGAATASIAQINLKTSAGTNPSSPADGDIWYDGTNLKMRKGATTYTITMV